MSADSGDAKRWRFIKDRIAYRSGWSAGSHSDGPHWRIYLPWMNGDFEAAVDAEIGRFPPLQDADVPDGCDPCRLCGGYCMEAEGVEDWGGRGFVIRIFSMCDESVEMDKDDIRTEFSTPDDAVEAWNALQRDP